MITRRLGTLGPICAALAWCLGGPAPLVAQRPGFNEPVVDEPLPPVEAARSMIVPDGFHVTLFAGEPDVMQPIGFAIDDRGRLWVAEAYNYPKHGDRPGDRIVILEDVDGDGRHDKRTVFYDRLNYVTGVEVGFGGAWVMSPPNFYFIPDRDGDDVPDGEPEVLLDGFGNFANAHNLANGFAWGPDGWLYGTHGRTNWSLPGKPGTPDDERTRFDGGVYRYHPVRRVWEPYADGTTNPWGIDWNDVGDAFVCNCVNPHLFHVIPGAHYEPWRNRASSRYAYERIDTIADHLHFVGAGNVREGLGSAAEDAAGGGHAHCGTMVYLGDNWPDRYRNSLFTNNIHGRRINNDLLAREGSGYTASHGPDLLRSRDPWYMGVTLQYGPDGSVFASDWSDTGECHSTKNTRRTTGRIYKISYGAPKAEPVDLAKLSDQQLVELQLHRNEWFARHARRLLQERAAAGRDLSAVVESLQEMFAAETNVTRKLRALWATYVVETSLPSPLVGEGPGLRGKASSSLDNFLEQQLAHDSEYIRAWSIRLLCESSPPASAITTYGEMARSDPSPYVRLYLAAMLQRLPLADRPSIAKALLAHAEDADDHNIPLMLWYGIEPLANDDVATLVELLDGAKMPLVARHIGRRAAELQDEPAAVEALVRRMPDVDSVIVGELQSGVLQGFAGRRSVPMPVAWPEVYARLSKVDDETVRERTMQLALVFDDATALAELRRRVGDTSLDAAVRNRAVAALVAKRPIDLPPLLLTGIADPSIRGAALRGLAEYSDPETPAAILARYDTFDAATRNDAVQTLAARKDWAGQLLDAVAAGRIPPSDISAYTARQIESFNDQALDAQLKTLWGELRTTPADKQRMLADYKKLLTPESLAKADRAAGRALFQKSCANCHKFFDAGGDVGPNITGSQRTNLDYLLQTIIDPSAAVNKDYRMEVFETSSGRVVTGLVVGETESAVTVRTLNEKIVLPATEIETRSVSPLSIMPEGQLQTLSLDQVRQLFAYLMGPDQVPLPTAP